MSMCPLNEFGNPKFAGDAGLAEATPCNFDTVLGSFCLQKVIGIFPALVFVMTFCSDGSCWTALRADLTGPVKIVKAIGVMIRVGPLGRAKGEVCDDAADADGFALRGDESIAQSEGPEPAGIGDMALGPIGGKTHPG